MKFFLIKRFLCTPDRLIFLFLFFNITYERVNKLWLTIVWMRIILRYRFGNMKHKFILWLTCKFMFHISESAFLSTALLALTQFSYEYFWTGNRKKLLLTILWGIRWVYRNVVYNRLRANEWIEKEIHTKYVSASAFVEIASKVVI